MPTVLVKSLTPPDKDQSFEVELGKILFDELERQGKSLPHGCLAGSCGSCRVLILEGMGKLSSPSPVEQDTIESIIKNYKTTGLLGPVAIENIRLACRAKVLGDIKITEI